MANAVPFIYFLGTAPGRYRALIPSFVIGWDAALLKARIAFAADGEAESRVPETSAERRYALRQVQQRLHQATFREAVITAYRGRCALSGLREPVLLDAAHIIGDAVQVVQGARLGRTWDYPGSPIRVDSGELQSQRPSSHRVEFRHGRRTAHLS